MTFLGSVYKNKVNEIVKMNYFNSHTSNRLLKIH